MAHAGARIGVGVTDGRAVAEGRPETSDRVLADIRLRFELVSDTLSRPRLATAPEGRYNSSLFEDL